MLRVTVCRLALPNDLIDEIILPKNSVEHRLDVMASVPIAVIVEATRFPEHAM